MRKQYSIWQKLLRRNRPQLTPEEMLNPRDHVRIIQTALVIAAILLNLVIILLLFLRD